MTAYSPTRTVDDIGHDQNPPLPPRGGGDDGRNEYPNYGARLRRARLGLICGMVTVSMLFISLTSAYVVRRGLPRFGTAKQGYFRDWDVVPLPWLLLGINTVILLVSSVTMEGARRNMVRRAALAPVQSIPGVSLGNERNFPWLAITVILGVRFLLGQWLAWGELKAHSVFVNTNPDASFIYLLTAAHALHLAGGIIAMIWVGITSLLHRPIEARRIAIDITGWYWHFMAVLWIYIFALIAFVR